MILEGGTHNQWAPPFDFLARAYQPIIKGCHDRGEITKNPSDPDSTLFRFLQLRMLRWCEQFTAVHEFTRAGIQNESSVNLATVSNTQFACGRILLLTTACVLLSAYATPTYGQSEMPEFTGERLTFFGVDSAAWQALPALITDLEKSGKQTYYVVVVESSGTGPTATRDYTDRLYEHWIQQAARNGITFDTQRSVLVVLAVRNRQLSVHAGQALLTEYGLNAQTIDQQLVQPHFIPHAKAGNYPEGVKVLLNQIHVRVVAHNVAGGQAEYGHSTATQGCDFAASLCSSNCGSGTTEGNTRQNGDDS